jgi:protein phosphatase
MIAPHGLTDIGRRRKINEDALFLGDDLFVLCDGMGGHQAGEVASALAVEAIRRFIDQSNEDRELTWPYGFETQLSYNGNRLRTAVKLANRSVFRKSNSAEHYTGMGTTVVAAMVDPPGGTLTFASVGDSRIYLIRERAIIQLARDDTWSNLFLPNAGPDQLSQTTAMKHVLTKVLGPREDVDFDVVDHPLHVGDLVLMCSDGLHNMVSDERLLEIVLAGRTDLEQTCLQLIGEANAQGGRDNVTAIVVARQA